MTDREFNEADRCSSKDSGLTGSDEMQGKKTLVVGPAWVGDMVMAQSLFKQIKQLNPDAQIDVIAPAWSQPLLERMPEVKQGIESPFAHGQFGFKARKQLGELLRENDYDQAILCTNSWKSALVPYYARIPKRTGWRGEWRYGLLNDVRLFDKQKYPLMVQRFLMLAFDKGQEQVVEQVPMPKLVCTAETVEAALQKYKLETTAAPVLVLCPGAEFGHSKRWPTEHYATVAKHYLAQGWQVWVLGSKNDAPVADSIQQQTQHRCVNLTGQTSLAEAIDLMSQADSVVSNDSGLMHIAAALAKPLVVVYGSSSPEFTPPLAKRVEIVKSNESCSPCFKRDCPLGHHNCMRQLLPERVIGALQSL